ncbi:MAG: UDP-N-acetylmuramoyl-L-alanine--D-glutamate ligase [Anaerolineales bacterium]|nr:UDP-N-acetylmuramoyl-L-alanine--D-glutamate ligase [Anaerolineales bacterium]
MMKDWEGKNLVIVGAARQGLALAKYLAKHGAKITVTDQRDKKLLNEVQQDFQEGNINWVLGGHPIEILDEADVLSLSGGVPLTIPLVQQAIQREIPLTNDSQVFMDIVPCPVIGITGSAGKTTTTLLVGKMAVDAFGEDHTWVGGNIGNPLIAVVDQITIDDIAVIELSSFQLELMTSAPKIACILNITPNHLDRHGTMQEYARAKARILDYQSKSDIAVLNREDEGSWTLRGEVKGDLITFGLEIPDPGITGTYLNGEMISYWDGSSSTDLISIESIRLRGKHNLMNALAACAIASAAGIPVESMKNGVEALSGVDHRLEYIRTWKEADWYNDSIATAPERSIAAINSFTEPLVLLAGGRDKDLPWNDFSRLVLKRVKYLILFGEAANLIERALQSESENGQRAIPYQKCANLKDAVLVAAEIVEPGDVVLLSPGGTSFDEFVNFAERGDTFRKWIKELS